MSPQFDDIESSQWNLVEEFVQRSSSLLLKKLSRNDTSWADHKKNHQSGFYVPKEIRESDFFPALEQRQDIPHIFEIECPSFWPQTGQLKRDSGLKHYSNKGHEAHFTRIPKDLFSGLSPASWLLGGTLHEPVGDAYHWFIVIDSQSPDAELLESRLDVQADFHFAMLEPSKLQLASRIEADEAAELIELIGEAIRRGTLNELLHQYGKLPRPDELSADAQAAFLRESGIARLDPWEITNPGDAVMRISRDIEYRIYKQHELRFRAVEVASVLSGHADTATAVVRGFPALDSIFLSASQQRKSRAGRSFENHLATLLTNGGVRFEPQAILGQRRPDFVLPDQATIALGDKRGYDEAAILSAKTTLRERWKQITHERFNCAIFLATVDDRVSGEALKELLQAEITLVVPESLKKSKETLYQADANVITFRDFFDREIGYRRATLLEVPRPPARNTRRRQRPLFSTPST